MGGSTPLAPSPPRCLLPNSPPPRLLRPRLPRLPRPQRRHDGAYAGVEPRRGKGCTTLVEGVRHGVHVGRVHAPENLQQGRRGTRGGGQCSMGKEGVGPGEGHAVGCQRIQTRTGAGSCTSTRPFPATAPPLTHRSHLFVLDHRRRPPSPARPRRVVHHQHQLCACGSYKPKHSQLVLCRQHAQVSVGGGGIAGQGRGGGAAQAARDCSTGRWGKEQRRERGWGQRGRGGTGVGRQREEGGGKEERRTLLLHRVQAAVHHGGYASRHVVAGKGGQIQRLVLRHTTNAGGEGRRRRWWAAAAAASQSRRGWAQYPGDRS